MLGISICFSKQEEETRPVVGAVWDFFARTIRSVDSLKRYQGLKSALRMVANQVSTSPLTHCLRHTCLDRCDWRRHAACRRIMVTVVITT